MTPQNLPVLHTDHLKIRFGQRHGGSYLPGTLDPLEDAEELALFRELRATEDPALRERLVRHNLRFVLHICHQTRPYDPEFWEWKVSGGQEGLLIAIDRFDPERGFQFSTYAVNWIRQKAQECAYAELANAMIGPKTHITQRWALWNNCRAKLENLKLRGVTDQELIDWIQAEGILWNSRPDWWLTLRECRQRLDWNASCPEEVDPNAGIKGHTTAGHQREDQLHHDPEIGEILEAQDLKVQVEALLAQIPENLAGVIRARYGLGEAGYPQSLAEVARERAEAGGRLITKQALHQLEHRGLAKLRQVAGVGVGHG